MNHEVSKVNSLNAEDAKNAKGIIIMEAPK
jgi:hypothetical protein